MRLLIVAIALCSGVGTIPCLLYLIWCAQNDAADAAEFRRKQDLKNRM